MLFKESLAQDLLPKTPDNAVSFPPTKGLYVGVSGDVHVITAKGTDVVIPALGAGAIHPISVSKVFATGTTATGILAAY